MFFEGFENGTRYRRNKQILDSMFPQVIKRFLNKQIQQNLEKFFIPPPQEPNF